MHDPLFQLLRRLYPSPPKQKTNSKTPACVNWTPLKFILDESGPSQAGQQTAAPAPLSEERGVFGATWSLQFC